MHLLFWLLRIITDEICFVFNICSEKRGGLLRGLDAFSCCLASVTQIRHEPWACEGTFICNLSPAQKSPCSCGWIQVSQFLHLHSFTDFSAWGDTAAGFKSLWMSKSRQKHHLRTLFCLWSKGSFPCLGVLSRTRNQPGLEATPHKWWNPLERGRTTRLSGLGPTDPPVKSTGLEFTTHTVSFCLFCTTSKTAFRTTCAKVIQQVIQNWFQLSGSHSSYHPVLQFPITFCTVYLWTLFLYLSIHLLHSFPANPLHTLTWKHQYTAKMRPGALTSCWSTWAVSKLVVAGLWGSRHTLSPQQIVEKRTKETQGASWLWYFGGQDYSITDGIVSRFLLHTMPSCTGQFITVHYWWRPKVEMVWEMTEYFHGRYTYGGF